MQHPGARRLNPDANGIATLTARQSRNATDDLMNLINKIGLASSRAQGLNHVITTYSSFSNSDCKMYILLGDDHKTVYGFVKIGTRNLFLWDRKGIQHERKGICLLDFITYPQCQRKGYGKKMIDAMLKDNNLEMSQIPIDRPSTLCLSFMAKHFGLKEYVNQNNNFVVFDQFWEGIKEKNDLPPALQFPSRQQVKFTLPPRKENQQGRANTPISNVLKQICNNPSKRTHYNPITWSLHQGIP